VVGGVLAGGEGEDVGVARVCGVEPEGPGDGVGCFGVESFAELWPAKLVLYGCAALR
jgi:hypothetical protein